MSACPRPVVKVECVIGQLKRKFPMLTKKINYQPDFVCNVTKACGFLWNLGILSGDNKGYNPDEYPIADEAELKDIASTPGGQFVCEKVMQLSMATLPSALKNLSPEKFVA